MIEKRRSERRLMDVPLFVRGESPDKNAFQEETFTITVNAPGALLMLAAEVSVGQRLTLINSLREEREARVAYTGLPHAGLAQVAVEFTAASPDFWSSTFSRGR